MRPLSGRYGRKGSVSLGATRVGGKRGRAYRLRRAPKTPLRICCRRSDMASRRAAAECPDSGAGGGAESLPANAQASPAVRTCARASRLAGTARHGCAHGRTRERTLSARLLPVVKQVSPAAPRRRVPPAGASRATPRRAARDSRLAIHASRARSRTLHGASCAPSRLKGAAACRSVRPPACLAGSSRVARSSRAVAELFLSGSSPVSRAGLTSRRRLPTSAHRPTRARERTPGWMNTAHGARAPCSSALSVSPAAASDGSAAARRTPGTHRVRRGRCGDPAPTHTAHRTRRAPWKPGLNGRQARRALQLTRVRPDLAWPPWEDAAAARGRSASVAAAATATAAGADGASALAPVRGASTATVSHRFISGRRAGSWG